MERKSKVREIQKKVIGYSFLVAIALSISSPSLAEGDGQVNFRRDVPLPTAEQWVTSNFNPVFAEFCKFITAVAGITVVKLLVMK